MVTDGLPEGWTSLVLLERFRGGDDRAADLLFARYFDRLAALARNRLSPRVASRVDPEDVALSVYRSFFRGARGGRFELRRGGDLWRLLAGITAKKLLRQVRHHRAGRRSVGLEIPIDQVSEGAIPGRRHEPTPEDAAALAEELGQVFGRLDPFGRRVLELRLQGAQVAEIADDTGRSERSVRRALAQIRALLDGRLGDA